MAKARVIQRRRGIRNSDRIGAGGKQITPHNGSWAQGHRKAMGSGGGPPSAPSPKISSHISTKAMPKPKKGTMQKAIATQPKRSQAKKKGVQMMRQTALQRPQQAKTQRRVIKRGPKM